MHRLALMGLSMVALGGCVAADPMPTAVDYGLPDHVNAVPNGATPASGLAVIDSNPGQLLHLFTDVGAAGRHGLTVSGTGSSVIPLAISAQPGMPSAPEQWRTPVQGDGQIWLQQATLGKCLDGNLALQACGALPSGWRLVPVLYSDLARLRHTATGQCLTLSTDANTVIMGGCDAAAVWRVEVISAAGSGLVGEGYGTVQVSSRGALSTLGSASARPCTDAALFDPSLFALSWLQVSNGGDSLLTLDRLDGQSNVVSLGTLAPHASEVLQVPGGSLVRVSTGNQCLGFVDTAVVLRINTDGSFLAQGGTLHVCADQNSLHSMNSLRFATLRVLNDTAEPLTLNWLPYAAGAAPVPFSNVANGNIATLYTYQTHPWMLSAADSTCRGILTLNPDPQP